MNRAFHIYSFGNNVIFRKESDFVSANNKIAVSCHSNGTSLLAFSIMSTHVHLLVEAANETCAEDLCSQIVKNYSISYKLEYRHSLNRNFLFSIKAIEGYQPIRQELLYVMRNPVHHYVTTTPFEYRFSSSPYLFWDRLSLNCLIESYLNSCVKICKLSQRSVKKIVGKHNVPDDWLVTPDGMLLPTSYLPLERIRAYWNGNVKNFLVDMNRNVLDSNGDIQKADLLDIRTSEYNDIQVCKMIDDFATENACASFHFLDDRQTARIRNILLRKGVNESQIARCLWLDDNRNGRFCLVR